MTKDFTIKKNEWFGAKVFEILFKLFANPAILGATWHWVIMPMFGLWEVAYYQWLLINATLLVLSAYVKPSGLMVRLQRLEEEPKAVQDDR